MLTVPHIIDLGIRKIPLTDVLFPSFSFFPIHTVGTILDPRRRSRLCLFSPIPRTNFSIQSVCILPSHIPFTCDCFVKTLPETIQNLRPPPSKKRISHINISLFFLPLPPIIIRFLQMSGMTAGAIIDADRRLIAHEKLMRNRKKVARDAEVWRRYEEDYQLLLEEQATPTGTPTGTPTSTASASTTAASASTSMNKDAASTNKDAALPPKNKKEEEE